MLKRQQVLLTDYLVDYIKYNAEKFDISFSELLRLSLCVQFGNWIAANYPHCKFDFTQKRISKLLKKIYGKKRREDEHHRLISEVYFETRKAIEYAMAHEKKPPRR